jgi:hypothetical protein
MSPLRLLIHKSLGHFNNLCERDKLTVGGNSPGQVVLRGFRKEAEEASEQHSSMASASVSVYSPALSSCPDFPL